MEHFQPLLPAFWPSLFPGQFFTGLYKPSPWNQKECFSAEYRSDRQLNMVGRGPFVIGYFRPTSITFSNGAFGNIFVTGQAEQLSYAGNGIALMRSLVTGMYLLAASLVPLLRAKYLITPGQHIRNAFLCLVPPFFIYLIIIIGRNLLLEFFFPGCLLIRISSNLYNCPNWVNLALRNSFFNTFICCRLASLTGRLSARVIPYWKFISISGINEGCGNKANIILLNR